MRYIAHDPAAVRRKGRTLTTAGSIFTAAVAVGALLDGSWANLMFFLLVGMVGVFVLAFGLSALREAKALDRERLLLGERPSESPLPRVEVRPRRPEVEPNPDFLPQFPTRRMICVSVMFVGLIAPLLYGAVRLGSFGGPGPLAALLVLGLSSWLCVNLVSLWQAKRWAWVAGVILFSVGLAFSLFPLGMAVWHVDPSFLAIFGAVTSHFVLGLIAMFSLRSWITYLDWKPGRDLLATADKPAVLAALRARKMSSEGK